ESKKLEPHPLCYPVYVDHFRYPVDKGGVGGGSSAAVGSLGTDVLVVEVVRASKLDDLGPFDLQFDVGDHPHTLARVRRFRVGCQVSTGLSVGGRSWRSAARTGFWTACSR